MKKHLVLGALAVLALAACTKSETLELNRGNEISLSAVSGKNLTKAANGYCNSHKPDDFQVWAATQGKTYFADKKYIEQSGTYVADGDKFFWPSGKVDFFAVKDYEGASSATADLDPTLDATKLTVTGYEVAHEVVNQKDFIYAVTKGVTKPAGGAAAEINFRHALSQIEFRAKNANPNIYVYIGGVTVMNVKNKGTFTMTTATTGNFEDHDNDETNEDPNPARTGRGTWDVQSSTDSYSVSFSPVAVPGDGVVQNLTYTGAEYDSKSMYLLPQTLEVWDGTGAAGATGQKKAYFVVKALIYNVAGSSFNPATDVVLWGEDDGLGNYGPKDIAVQLPDDMKWEDGFRYLYTFNFTNAGMGGSDPGTGDDVLTPITLTVTVDDFVDVADKEIKVE